MEIKIGAGILDVNQATAESNRQVFDRHGAVAVNLMGSPGAGKTTLLEKTIDTLKDRLKMAVIEGDIYTSKDAVRIEKHGIPVRQINTGGACHLDARMVEKTLPHFDLAGIDLMVIENVGNLVCPVEFNLGEHYKIAVLSITEGDDKPLKYPLIFKESAAVVLNKVDLLDFTDVNMDNLQKDILSINPQIRIFQVSARTGAGIGEWAGWLAEIAGQPGGE